MRNLIAKFMHGRYGLDHLSKFIMILWFSAAVLNVFFKSNIIYVISLIPAFIFFFRVLSRNTVKRSAENAKYQAIEGKVSAWIKFRWLILREIKTHRYIKCTGCHAVLRLPRKTGTHTTVCPRCKNRFKLKIII